MSGSENQTQEIKIGDKVKYKKTEAVACEVNGHKLDQVYTVKSINPTVCGDSVEEFKSKYNAKIDFAELIIQSEIQAEI